MYKSVPVRSDIVIASGGVLCQEETEQVRGVTVREPAEALAGAGEEKYTAPIFKLPAKARGGDAGVHPAARRSLISRACPVFP